LIARFPSVPWRRRKGDQFDFKVALADAHRHDESNRTHPHFLVSLSQARALALSMK